MRVCSLFFVFPLTRDHALQVLVDGDEYDGTMIDTCRTTRIQPRNVIGDRIRINWLVL